MTIRLLKNSFLLILFITISALASAQDIYDAEHSIKYAKYLECNEKYGSALNEYERTVKYINDNDSLKLKIIQLNQKVFGKDSAIRKIESFYPQISAMPLLYLKKYCSLLIITNQSIKLENVINSNKLLNDSLRFYYHFNNLIFSNKWSEINNTTIQYHDIRKQYKNILSQIKYAKYRSPFVAATMSAIVPGTGKIYTRNTRDGLYSLLIIAVNTFEAYRGFNKYGTSSVLGWVTGSIAFGYYAGGIYGSWKAADKFNDQFNKKIHNETEDILLDR